ncbi:GNAT family N-acetyltransferase [Mesobaculum littorinae]|uniref:GNAT family N-acetyltransferase n=2 Tax=Mesobaculum littorinae TaxID=2486419 RepID=A0A438AJX5_9RHOB|nr:GNAT family N-acetyltransferase [Mesobaculum littorinae]
MDSDVQIARLVAADLALFQAIRLESLRRAPADFANTEADWTALSRDDWLARLKTPVFAALRGGDPVGVMGLLPQTGEKRAHRAKLVMVYLRDTERGRGLADALLARVMEFAADTGIRQLELSVNATNARAVRFYERHGFATVGRIPRALIDAGRDVDELIMIRAAP